MIHGARRFSLSVLAMLSLSACHATNFGAREALGSAAEAALARECSEIGRIGTVSELRRSLRRRVDEIIELSSRRPVSVEEVQRAAAEIENVTVRLRSLADPALLEQKWDVIYRWRVSANDLLKDSGRLGEVLARPAVLSAKDGRVFGLRSADALRHLEIKHEVDQDAATFDVRLPMKASSFELCTLDDIVAIDAQVAFATTLGMVKSDVALLVRSEGENK